MLTDERTLGILVRTLCTVLAINSVSVHHSLSLARAGIPWESLKRQTQSVLHFLPASIFTNTKTSIFRPTETFTKYEILTCLSLVF